MILLEYLLNVTSMLQQLINDLIQSHHHIINLISKCKLIIYKKIKYSKMNLT